MVRTVILRLKPDKIQFNKMMRIAGCARFCYNELLNYWNNVYNETKKSPTDSELRTYIKDLQDGGYDWLVELPYHTKNGVIENLKNAFNRFFKGLANHPTTHKRNRNRASFLVRTDRIKVYNNQVTVPSVGTMGYKNISKYELNGIKRAYVVYDGKCWYLKISTEVYCNKTEKQNHKIGVDLGYRSLITVFNGQNGYNIDNIINSNKISKLVSRLKQIDKVIAAKKKFNETSKNITRLYEKRARLMRKITNIQNDYLHNVSKKLVNSTECIVLETLDISEQKARDSVVPEKYKSTALYKLYSYILYKAQEQGVKIIHADKYFPSTKQCYRCKALNNAGASKIYTCSHCGITIDRDYNAAINLYRYA